MAHKTDGEHIPIRVGATRMKWRSTIVHVVLELIVEPVHLMPQGIPYATIIGRCRSQAQREMPETVLNAVVARRSNPIAVTNRTPSVGRIENRLRSGGRNPSLCEPGVAYVSGLPLWQIPRERRGRIGDGSVAINNSQVCVVRDGSHIGLGLHDESARVVPTIGRKDSIPHADIYSEVGVVTRDGGIPPRPTDNGNSSGAPKVAEGGTNRRCGTRDAHDLDRIWLGESRPTDHVESVAYVDCAERMRCTRTFRVGCPINDQIRDDVGIH